MRRWDLFPGEHIATEIMSHSFLKPASAFVSVRVGMMTFGMTHGSSYSAAPMAEAMVMPSPVFMALPRYWKPISLMAGTS